MFRSKQSRLLCLLFALILCFQSFGSVGVSAADSENLVDSDLRNWDLFYPDQTLVRLKTDNAYLINVSPVADPTTGVNVSVGGVYDLNSLTNGDSYTFSLKYLSPTEMGVSSALADSIYSKGGVFIGFASKTADDYFDWVPGSFVEISSSNYTKYYGQEISISYTMENIVNPCIVIVYTGTALNWDAYFGVSDVKLVNDTVAKEDGFLSKLFAWFQEKFDSIGESFTNLGNKLTELKDGFINKITDLKESFQAKIDELKQSLTDLKDNLIEGIKSLFVPDEQAILDWKESLNELLKEHLGIIYTCSDLLTDTLNLAFDIIFDAPDTYEVKIPEVSFEAAGTTVPVFTSQNIDFSFMEKPVFKGLYSMYTVAMYIFFGALEVKYALRVYRKVMNN